MLRKRQVHLDFHTSGALPVGNKFSKEQFQSALKAGHVNSITVFSKCHHGWSYHPTEVGDMHPGLGFDLLGAQLEACKEIGVNAPVYISAGFDEKEYDKHPEWRYRCSDDENECNEYHEETHFHLLCFNTGYLDFLCRQTEEVMQKYNPSGIFFDIISPKVCYCEKCVADIKALGLDINNEDDRRKFADITLNKYIAATNAAVRKHSETATIFHNGGHIHKGNYDFIECNTHLELESLPTAGWGYDHFPLSAAYVRSLKNTEFLGMTGKFHQGWGEFGGYKHPNALIYETALSVANGAGCSIGDQMHNLAEMNPATYNLIGKAYSLIEEREPWLNGAVNVADIAVLSAAVADFRPEVVADQKIKKNPDNDTFTIKLVKTEDILTTLKVVKRNGKKVDFDGTKIALAIKKGFDSIICDDELVYIGKVEDSAAAMMYEMRRHAQEVRKDDNEVYAYLAEKERSWEYDVKMVPLYPTPGIDVETARKALVYALRPYGNWSEWHWLEEEEEKERLGLE